MDEKLTRLNSDLILSIFENQDMENDPKSEERSREKVIAPSWNPFFGSQVFVLVDPELQIVEANTAAEMIIGLPRQALVGKDLREVFEAAGLNPVGLLRMLIEIRSGYASSRPITSMNDHDQKPVLEANLYAIKDSFGRPAYYLLAGTTTAYMHISGLQDNARTDPLRSDHRAHNENAVLSYLFEASSQINSLRKVDAILHAATQAIARLPLFSHPVICLVDDYHHIRSMIYNNADFPAKNLEIFQEMVGESHTFPFSILKDDFRLGWTYLFTQDLWQAQANGNLNHSTLKNFPFSNDVLVYLLRLSNQHVFGVALIEYTATEQKLSAGTHKALEIFLNNVSAAVDSRVLENQISKVNKELERKNNDLAQIDKLKAEFVNNIAHEIKTPLSVGMGYTEMLSSTMFGTLNDRQREGLDQVLESLYKLNNILSGLLDFSELSTGIMKLDILEYNLKDLIIGVMAQRHSIAASKGLALMADLPMEPVRVMSDHHKIEIVLRTLIDNAIKFSESGTITVGMKLQTKKVLVFVRDEGIGMTSETSDVIFDDFRQGDGSATRKYGGLGLGLSLTRHIINLHEEKFWVESEPEKGSTFYFTLTPVEN